MVTGAGRRGSLWSSISSRWIPAGRSTPLFGQVSLWVVLLTGALLVLGFERTYPAYEKGPPVSFLGLALPETLIGSRVLFDALRATYLVSGALWALRLLPRVVPWICALSYCGSCSLFWENLPWFRHKYVVPAWILIVYACWYSLYLDEISAAHGRRFWKRRLFPQWVVSLSLLAIALLYFYSAVSKLAAAGPSWGDGRGLQIWLTLGGQEDEPLVAWLLSDLSHAALAQRTTLVVELGALLAVFVPRARIPLGLALIAFHFLVESTLGLSFRSNTVLVVLYFFPWEALCRRRLGAG